MSSNNASVSRTKVNTPKKMDGMQVAIVSERKRRQELERRTQKNKRTTDTTKKRRAADAPKVVTWKEEGTVDDKVEVSETQTKKEINWLLAIVAGDEEDRKIEDCASSVSSESEDEYDDDDHSVLHTRE